MSDEVSTLNALHSLARRYQISRGPRGPSYLWRTNMFEHPMT